MYVCSVLGTFIVKGQERGRALPLHCSTLLIVFLFYTIFKRFAIFSLDCRQYKAFLFWPEVVPSGKYCYIYSLKILSGGASLGYLSM